MDPVWSVFTLDSETERKCGTVDDRFCFSVVSHRPGRKTGPAETPKTLILFQVHVTAVNTISHFSRPGKVELGTAFQHVEGLVTSRLLTDTYIHPFSEYHHLPLPSASYHSINSAHSFQSSHK